MAPGTLSHPGPREAIEPRGPFLRTSAGVRTCTRWWGVVYGWGVPPWTCPRGMSRGVHHPVPHHPTTGYTPHPADGARTGLWAQRPRGARGYPGIPGILGNTREYTGIHGNTGYACIAREYTGIHGNTGIPGTHGIPGNTGIPGIHGNTREYREYGPTGL